MTVLAAAADTGVSLGTGEAVVFWVLAPIALAGALGMVFSRNAVHSALWLVNTMLALGVFYVVQEAPFLGAVQIIVYTGAIMILFLFVLMLVGRDSSDSVVETLRGQRVAATVLGVGFAGLVAAVMSRATRATSRRSPSCCSRSTCWPSRAPAPCSSPPRSARWCSRTSSASPAAGAPRRSCPGPGSSPT